MKTIRNRVWHNTEFHKTLKTGDIVENCKKFNKGTRTKTVNANKPYIEGQ